MTSDQSAPSSADRLPPHDAQAFKREHRIEQHIESLGAKIVGTGSERTTNRCAMTEHKPGHLCVTVNVEKQVWHCNDCKQGGDIITWIAIQTGNPVGEVLKGLGGNGASKPLPAREIVATYDYRSATGDLAYQVVRLAPKSFRQRQPDRSRPGEWVWNMEGVERVLYRLPELARDIERGLPVFIVEGEKDVAALIHQGLTATCNSGGAGKWQASYSEALRGADVIIIPDKDEPGRKHGETIAVGLQGIARRVRVLELPEVAGKTVKDVHDFFAAGGDVGQLQDLVDHTSDWKEHANVNRLTIRSPDEILAQPQDPHDNILGDRLLAKGQSVTLLGPGGIGKSRMLLQWAAVSIAGQPFIGIETHGAGLRWLVFQVENANRRLQSDLNHLRAAYRDDWATINERLLIHTLETDRDGWLSLDAEENQFAIAQAIETHAPDIVVFDPLNQFAIGDPNKDQDMAATCQIITRLCRKGNPQRAITILHHTITGRAGAAKSFGVERAGYGRNSKVLQAWTRGQINLAPISEDSSDLLAVLCGKCSNGKEFAPFAVRLNPETMLYEVAPDVDMDAWRADMAGKSSGPLMTPSKVRELCHVGGMEKSELARAIIADCGCARGTAYRQINGAEKAKLITPRKSDGLYFRK